MYCIVGEAVAFLTGWLTLLHHITAASAMARGISQNFDALTEFCMLNFTLTFVGNIDVINSHVDFLGFFVVFAVMTVVALGVKMPGTRVSLIIQIIVSLLFLFIVVFGAFKSNFFLWSSATTFFHKGAAGVSTLHVNIIIFSVMFCII